MIFSSPHSRLLRSRHLSGMALIFTLAGCAGLATQGPRQVEAGQPAAASRPYQEAIDITGRLSIRYQQNGQEEAVHGSFTWTQQPNHLLLTLLSPLGQTMATIESTAGGVILRQAGQPPRMANDVDALTAQTLGWPLPVSGLRYWLQGFAVKADGSQWIAVPGTDASVVTTEDGWQLQYASWNQDAPSPHPRRIDLQRDTQQAGHVEIRLIIDSWQLPR